MIEKVKDKARELVNKYYLILPDTSYDRAKQCALIAVDEIIELITNRLRYYINYDKSIAYWNEVKKEIKKL